VLEMIRGRPSALSGKENKVFADRLMGRDSVGRTLLRVKTRERFKVENGSPVKSSFVGLVYCVERTC